MSGKSEYLNIRNPLSWDNQTLFLVLILTICTAIIGTKGLSRGTKFTFYFQFQFQIFSSPIVAADIILRETTKENIGERLM